MRSYPDKYHNQVSYKLEAKDDYGTVLSNEFYIREWVKFDSDTRFEIGKKNGNLFVEYNGGSQESITIPKSDLFSDGSIFVTLTFYNVRYPFPRIIITNSEGKPYEYYVYHEKLERIYPVSGSGGMGTRIILSDDYGNQKTFYFRTQ